MSIDIFTWHKMLESRLMVCAALLSRNYLFRARYIIDPLSRVILSAVPRYHKLEVFVLSCTLLRYNDAKKLNLSDWLSGKTQIIQQGKTKEDIEVPPLFLSQDDSKASDFPAVTLFTEGYDKLRYSLLRSIPTDLRAALKSERTVTHIFRFLRSTFYFITDKNYWQASKYLGHKDPESIKSYVPPELLRYYSNHLSKG